MISTNSATSKVAGPMGFTIARPMEYELRDRRTNSFFDAIKEAKRANPKLQMVTLKIS